MSITTALWWSRNVRLGREGGPALPSDRYYELRYEALVTRPEAECSALCAFLELAYDDAMVRFHEGRVRRELGLTPKQAWLPITPNLRNWRDKWRRATSSASRAAARDFLDELGYELAFPRPSEELHVRAGALRNRLKAELQAKNRRVPAAW